jgi:galactokinase/mevalonate kinase-like predicted kinase
MPDGKIVWSAPGRCGIVGNPSDMYGGAVISCSTRERARVTVEDADALEIEGGGRTRVCRKTADFRQDGGMFDAALAAGEYFELESARMRIGIASDIPIQAGLSGSTAVMAALTAGLLEWIVSRGYGSDERVRRCEIALGNRYILAEAVRHIELYFLKIICGYQDAYMCTFGSLRFLDFSDKENYLSLKREPLGTVEDLAGVGPEPPLVLVHTGVQRVSGSVHKPVRDRWMERDPLVVTGVLRLAYIARMAKHALLLGDWELLGEAMTENHEIVRSFGSSSEVNERIISIALDSGAIAAKLAGAGKGGTIIALHPEPEKLVEAIHGIGAGRIMYPAPCEGVRGEKDAAM